MCHEIKKVENLWHRWISKDVTMPGTMWNVLQILFHLILIALRNKCPSYPRSTDKRTKAKGGLVTFPWSQLCQTQEPGYEAKDVTSKQPSQLLHHAVPPRVWGWISQSLGIRGNLTIFFPWAFLSIRKSLHLPYIIIGIRKQYVLKEKSQD